MLTSIRIQNFRSIRDASVKLGQVNLFIGPNNSGKSNFLKGIRHLVGIASLYPNPFRVGESRFKSNLSKKEVSKNDIPSINFTIDIEAKGISLPTLTIGHISNGLILLLDSAESQNATWGILANDNTHLPSPYHSVMEELQTEIQFAPLYKLEPSQFIQSVSLEHQVFLSESGNNIVNFIYYLSQNHRTNFSKLEKDLAKCVGSIVSVSTPADPEETGKLRLRFFDENENGYWADEVSEGVLYFLALLCIIHQPNSPKLLLLEEPEKGIHPRRIQEVVNLIFELARQHDIQIILTSHSPYVVDHFADIPECISVFDHENGETVIHNAADIIAKTNTKLEVAGEEPIHYTDALGEYWVSGFLGGVPGVLTSV